MSYLPYAVGAWLVLVGLYGVATSRHLVHLVQCLAVSQSGSYVLLLAVGFRVKATAPIFYDEPTKARAVDPVVQALTLTDVVVSVTISALLLAVAVQVYKRQGSLDPADTRVMRG